MKVYYCQKEFDNAVDYLASKHTAGNLKNKAHLSSILLDLLNSFREDNYLVGTAGFYVRFSYDYKEGIWADILVTPHLSYTDDDEDYTAHLEIKS